MCANCDLCSDMMNCEGDVLIMCHHELIIVFVITQ